MRLALLGVRVVFERLELVGLVFVDRLAPDGSGEDGDRERGEDEAPGPSGRDQTASAMAE